jgi:hypothetical protein
MSGPTLIYRQRKVCRFRFAPYPLAQLCTLAGWDLLWPWRRLLREHHNHRLLLT